MGPLFLPAFLAAARERVICFFQPKHWLQAKVTPRRQDVVANEQHRRHSLVELCFLHWYTPSLFGEADGASSPSRSMGSNCTRPRDISDSSAVHSEMHARQRTNRSLPSRRRSNRRTVEEGRSLETGPRVQYRGDHGVLTTSLRCVWQKSASLISTEEATAASDMSTVRVLEGAGAGVVGESALDSKGWVWVRA